MRRSIIDFFFAGFCFLFACFFSDGSSAWMQAQDKNTIDFVRDIKPILSDRCFQCHGPDENQRKADLRLDLPQEDVGSVIKVGNADQSDLIARIASDDPDQVMPPPDANKKALTAKEIATFKAWINQGAKFEGHWAYQSPSVGPLPRPTSLQDWAQTPIDLFVAKHLEKAGKKPSAPAEKRVLIRRVYFDLIGLPPSPEQVQAYLGDDSPRAFEKIVDQLLASKAFGERMAVFWLDQVRYADTNGIHGDNHRDHSLFRDYVIDAFNSNMPFDQFTLEQLAGDLLESPTNQQRIASGYNRLNMTTREGGAQAKEYRAKYAADRVRNASVVWMGSTLGCAECHDHKYDPFKSEDFYRFAAFFSDIEETAVGQQKPIRLPSMEQEQKLASVQNKLAAAMANLEARTDERDGLFQQFLDSIQQIVAAQKPTWIPVVPREMKSSDGSTLKAEQSIVTSSGKNPAKDNYTLVFEGLPAKVTGFRLEVLADPALPNQSVGRGNGNIVLTNVVAERDGESVKIKKAMADFSQPNHDVQLAIDNNPATGWAVSGHTQKANRTAVFVFEKPLEGNGKKRLTIQLMHQSIYAQHNIGKFRISLSDVATPGLSNNGSVPADVITILKKEKPSRSEAETKRLYGYFLDTSDTMKTLRESVQQLQKAKTDLEKSFRSILVTKSIKPRMTRVLPRGNWLDDSGPVVQPGVPSFLTQIKGTANGSPNRYDLAKWIVDPANPLTARVIVNRLWKIAFGSGLVRTPDDFGSQGRIPTHPRLLDYLAGEFVESGWNMKALLKSIVLSNTYKQSSMIDPDTAKEDPDNLLLTRQNRFRLDAEFVRDNALMVSGLLIEQVGGDSVKPYQPTGYWQHLNFPRRTYQASGDQNQYRRGLYSYWCRTFLHPSLSVFDAPSREESCVQRPRSNTPLQALVLLNDPSYVEAAQALAETIMRREDLTENRISLGFRMALGRKPTAKESGLLTRLLNDQLEQFSQDADSSKKAIKAGNRSPASDLDATTLAAWASVTRVLLNLHETITRY